MPAFDEEYRELIVDARDAIYKLLDGSDHGSWIVLRSGLREIREAFQTEERAERCHEIADDLAEHRRAFNAEWAELTARRPLRGPIVDLERAFNGDPPSAAVKINGFQPTYVAGYQHGPDHISWLPIGHSTFAALRRGGVESILELKRVRDDGGRICQIGPARWREIDAALRKYTDARAASEVA